MLFYVVLFSFLGGVLSLAGGIILAYTKKGRGFATYATAFAAGALLAAAFLDLLPEALEDGDVHLVLLAAMGGLVFFFLLEGALNWFHVHSHHAEHKVHPVVPMIILGDTIHNFIDGVVIAAAFLVSPASGIVVTLAVAAHEIPQEIGDFAIMLKSGLKREKVLAINIYSSLATVASATVFYLLGDSFEFAMWPLIALAAGFFIYIATTDIIPTIHQEKNKREMAVKSTWLVAGILIVGLLIEVLHI